MNTSVSGHMYGILAREALGRPDAHVASVESLNEDDDGFDGVRVVLMDAPALTRGPRKGQPNWRSATNRQVRLLSREQIESGAERWSERTGLCVSCVGDGRSFSGWRLGEGSRFVPCKTCNGTGSADGVSIALSRDLTLFEASP
jgi:hypothetical protein